MLGLAALLTAAAMATATPASAQRSPVSGQVESTTAGAVVPLVTGCNGTMPSGWQYRASYSYCYECRAAGQFWEATGRFRAHCQTYGDGVRLWTFCVACRVEGAQVDEARVRAVAGAASGVPGAGTSPPRR